MTFKWYLALCCFIGALQAEEYAYFTPPQDWKVIEHSPFELSVKVSFVGKPKKNCSPLINLATEEVSISLKEYLAIVQANCQADPNREWRDLGVFSTLAGEGGLVEIVRRTEGGDLRQLQLILIKEGTAYVVTTSCAKEEFPELCGDFYACLKSFNITSDLIEGVKQKDAKDKLRNLCFQILKAFPQESQIEKSQLFSEKKFQKETWLPFEKTILTEYSEMGNYWKILLLKDIRDKLISNQD
jgi:hypothetical protein